MNAVAFQAQVTATPTRLVKAAPELEAFPIVAQRALVRLQRADATVESMAELLGTDQALAAAVLRQVNSASAMPNRRIGSLREALARIGLRALWELLIRAVSAPVLDRGLPPYALSRRSAWRHAATTSRAARQFAAAFARGNPDEASVAGLLHDVGKTVLSSVVPDLTAEIVSLARAREIPVWEAERDALGFDHGTVGAALLKSWGLPEAVSQAVAHHHDAPGAKEPSLAPVIHLADVAAHLVGASGGAGACPPPDLNVRAARQLGFGLAELPRLLTGVTCVEEGGL